MVELPEYRDEARLPANCYVLRGQRCVTYQAMIAILDVCQVSCGGSRGMSVGITHPLYGVLTITLALLASIAILVLAVCLPDIKVSGYIAGAASSSAARSHRACWEPARPQGTRRCVQSVALPGLHAVVLTGILWICELICQARTS